jgi:hypothetical protein
MWMLRTAVANALKTAQAAEWRLPVSLHNA